MNVELVAKVVAIAVMVAVATGIFLALKDKIPALLKKLLGKV